VGSPEGTAVGTLEVGNADGDRVDRTHSVCTTPLT
jgi:hypothetical protein